jgi:hypothetical protein
LSSRVIRIDIIFYIKTLGIIFLKFFDLNYIIARSMNLKDLEIYNARGILSYVLSYLYIIEGAVGMFITILVLITNYQTLKKSKSATLKISLGILITDVIFCTMLLLMGVTANINGEYIASHSWLCGLYDIFYMGSKYISIWYVTLLSLERGLLIIYKFSIPLWFWLGVMAAELLGFLILNIISISLNQMGLAELAISCMSSPNYPAGYATIVWYNIMMVFSLVVAMSSYIGIAVAQRMKAWKDIRELHMDKENTLKQANRTVKRVLILLFLYLACNLIEIINIAYEFFTGYTRSGAADFAAIVMINFNPTINCVILVSFHEHIKSSLLANYPFLNRFVGKCDTPDDQIHSVLNNIPQE